MLHLLCLLHHLLHFLGLVRALAEHGHARSTPLRGLLLAVLTLARPRPAHPPARAFIPRSAPSRQRHRRKPAWVGHSIVRLHRELGTGCRKLAHEFNRRHAASGMRVGKTFVADTLRQYRYTRAAIGERYRHRVPRPIPANRRWAIDATGKGDASGATHAILGLLDHGSRYLLRLQYVPRLNTYTVLGHLLIAIGSHGKPQALRCDNASLFRSRLFRTALIALGIRQEFISPGAPWQNGRIERLYGTLKEKLDRIVPNDAAALASLLIDFRHWYNLTRPHQHLHGHTPWEVWHGIDAWAKAPRAVEFFEAWGGLLRGYYLQR